MAAENFEVDIDDRDRDPYQWIAHIIDKQRYADPFHFKGLKKLIELFKQQFPDKVDLYFDLIDKAEKRWAKFHGVDDTPPKKYEDW